MTPAATTTLDVDQLRQDTPGCQHVTHLNNAGAALMPQPVIDAMKDHIDLEAKIGGYEAARKANDKVENTYHAVSQLIGATQNEIAIVENATRAWDMAFYGFPFQPGDTVLASQAEYASNAIPMLQLQQEKGIQVKFIPNDEHGQIDIQALENVIDKTVKLIALTHVPTNGGLVNPADKVGKIAKQANIPFLLDACQSAGQLPINVDTIGCDMLSATGRKYLRGPRGIGFLYVRQSFIEKITPPLLDLHAATWTSTDAYTIRNDAKRFENWETNYAAKIGLGVAIDYALNVGLENSWPRIRELATFLRTNLKQIPQLHLHDQGQIKGGIVSFTVEEHSAKTIQEAMAKHHINISISPQEYTRLDMEQRHLNNIIRASVHYYNTKDEIHQFCQKLQKFCN